MVDHPSIARAGRRAERWLAAHCATTRSSSARVVMSGRVKTHLQRRRAHEGWLSNTRADWHLGPRRHD